MTARASQFDQITASRAGPLVVLVSALALLGWKFLGPVVPLDEGIVLSYPQFILRGLIPNLDFCSLYPPGNYWLMSAVFSVFPNSLAVERIVGLGYVLTAEFALYSLGARYSTRSGIIAALLASLSLELFPDALAAYAWFGGVAFLLVGIAVLRHWLDCTSGSRRSIALLVAAGILGGLTVDFRHDLAPALLVSSALIVGPRPRYLALYAAGLFIGAFPLLLQFIMATPAAFIENLVFDVMRADPGRRLPIPWLSKLFWLLATSCIIPLLMAVAGWLLLPRHRTDRLLSGSAAIGLFVLPQATSRVDKWHLAYIGFVTLPLAYLSTIHVCRAWAARQRQGGFDHQAAKRVGWLVGGGDAALALIAIVVSVLSLQALLAGISTYRNQGSWVCRNCVTNEGRSLPVEKNGAALQQIVDKLEAVSKPNDRLYVGPRDMARTNYNDSFIFFLFPKLQPSQFYVEVAPGVSNRPGTRTAADITKADFVLTTTAYDNWNEPNASAIRGSEEPGRILDLDFCLLAEQKPYQLYSKCPKNPNIKTTN